MASGFHYRRALRSGYSLVSPRRWMRRLVFWGGALAVGLAAMVFAISGYFADEFFRHAMERHPWVSLLVMPAGLALIAWLTRTYFPGAQGSGIPQTIAALRVPDKHLRASLLSMRIAMGKIALTTLALLSGASVGREGPTVQIGASILHALGSVARFPRQEVERGLIVAGGAAGVAAAFNTPLAGIVFAIEELSRSFEHRTNGTVLTAVIFAGVTSLAVLGNYTYFGATSAALGMRDAAPAVLLVGGCCGLAGGLFARLVREFTTHGLPGPPGRLLRQHPVRFAALCGLVLALIGLASAGTTYGTGYQEAKRLFEDPSLVPESFGVFKFLATLVSFMSGIPGGIFAPSLSVGAGFGANLAWAMPHLPAGALVLLGMVAYFTGVVQAPLTGFIIVMEMTDNHDMVLPLMATALVAQGASRMVCREPLYRFLAEGFLRRLAVAARSPELHVPAQQGPGTLGGSAEPAPPEPSPQGEFDFSGRAVSEAHDKTRAGGGIPPLP